MEVYQAAEILLKAVHDDMNGTISFSDFLRHQTKGYDDRTTVELQAIYNRALLVLMDEGLCHRGINADTIELGQKGIDCKGDYKRYVKKRDTRNFLEKTRRILPIPSFIIVVAGFYITYIKKQSNNEKERKAKVEQHKKDSILEKKRGRR